MKLASRAVLRGILKPPGDKSIAHRVALLGALAKGTSRFDNFAPGEDCRRTLDIIERLGVAVERQGDAVSVYGRGYFGFLEPASTLDAGNSGSTARMACGVLAAQPFDSRLDGDESLRRRPMKRVTEPLELMGAKIETADGGRGTLPLHIRGGRSLRAIDYRLPIASAQVKTAILLAGLHAEGRTTVREPIPSRNHTELALPRFGVPVEREEHRISIQGGAPLAPVRVRIPGDPSSAAFFVTAASLLPGSELVVQNVGLNPTRTGFLEVLKSMGARLVIEEDLDGPVQTGWERSGSIRVWGSELHGTLVPPELVPTLIDEIPILAVAGALARGETVIRGVSELRYKESDRLAGIASGLRSMGADVEVLPDSLAIRGGPPLTGADLDSQGDHRMAMAWAVASLAAEGSCRISGRDVVTVSYPGFWLELERLAA